MHGTARHSRRSIGCRRPRRTSERTAPRIERAATRVLASRFSCRYEARRCRRATRSASRSMRRSPSTAHCGPVRLPAFSGTVWCSSRETSRARSARSFRPTPSPSRRRCTCSRPRRTDRTGSATPTTFSIGSISPSSANAHATLDHRSAALSVSRHRWQSAEAAEIIAEACNRMLLDAGYLDPRIGMSQLRGELGLGTAV